MHLIANGIAYFRMPYYTFHAVLTGQCVELNLRLCSIGMQRFFQKFRGWLHETGMNSDSYQSENILKCLHETGMKLKPCSCKQCSPHSEFLFPATMFFLFFALSLVDLESFRVFMMKILQRSLKFEPVWTHSCGSNTQNEWDRSELIFRTGLM